MSLFKVVFHNNGYYVKYQKLRYKDNEVYAYKGKDSDFWSYIKACDLIKGMDSKFEDDVKPW